MLKLLKPLHAPYNYFASCRRKEIIKVEWKTSGITDAIHKTRTQQVNVINLNPFT